MRWTRRFHRAGVPNLGTAPHSAGRRLPSFVVLILITACAILLSGAPPEKHLSVYSTVANYSLPLVQREGRDYVGFLELLEPLGPVNARFDGPRWRLRYNNRVEGDFQAGKNRVRIQGRDTDLPGKFLAENGRGLVPVAALGILLPRFLGGPVSLHDDSGRLFIGNVATHFTASLAADNSSRLVFHFTSPVNPSVATEPGALRLTFNREPVVAPASPTLTFGSKTIPSANYTESNGTAVITVNAATPVMASFSSDGRTVTISPTSATAAASQNSRPSTTPGAPVTPSQSGNAPTAPGAPGASVPPVARHYFAVVDAAHGGDDRGESLGSTLVEKDVTLVLARSLRQELESRGIPTLVLRDSDTNLSLEQRAILSNTNHAAIYISLHAASAGHGVRIYTALLPYGGGDDRGPFRFWATSQRPALPLSQSTASGVAGEMQKRQIPVRILTAPLRPLNNLTAAAFALELAPQGSDVMQLTAPDYQQLVTSAVATAIAAARDNLGAAQ